MVNRANSMKRRLGLSLHLKVNCAKSDSKERRPGPNLIKAYSKVNRTNSMERRPEAAGGVGLQSV
ncbi:hypothetical protein M378DRAFT_161646 [Amanita muscaria Koide BX008]|uniref:Uncharacterized protein n=1 Tax=Amanita muscaria (strain Koide BX008) TaxID=946122 RepID=A0A0C2X8N8_AMAMK|nr:hypothetical protein M378DRAFT_161646 [Amanita muscaria Koide BX008]